MKPISPARERRAAVQADRDGSGPTLADRPSARFPGATGAFALFGEVLVVGLLVTLVGVLVVTLPAGMAAGARHLRRYIRAERSALALFWRDVRRALPGGALVGAVALVAVLLLLLDIDLARSGFLPGGLVVEIIGWAGLATVAVALLATTSAWSPDSGWRAALRSVPRTVRNDVPGSLYLVATAVFVVAVTWALIPLLLPALGLAVLAGIAIPERRRVAS